MINLNDMIEDEIENGYGDANAQATVCQDKKKKKVVLLKQEVGEYMTANRFILYWRSNKDWYIYNEQNDCYELTDKAPDEARKIFEEYKRFNHMK